MATPGRAMLVRDARKSAAAGGASGTVAGCGTRKTCLGAAAVKSDARAVNSAVKIVPAHVQEPEDPRLRAFRHVSRGAAGAAHAGAAAGGSSRARQTGAVRAELRALDPGRLCRCYIWR